MTGRSTIFFIVFLIYKVKINVSLNIKVKRTCYECKNLIYHVIFLELYLSGRNKQPGVNAIHCYATHNGCNTEDSLEGGGNGVSCLACQQNRGAITFIN